MHLYQCTIGKYSLISEIRTTEQVTVYKSNNIISNSIIVKLYMVQYTSRQQWSTLLVVAAVQTCHQHQASHQVQHTQAVCVRVCVCVCVCVCSIHALKGGKDYDKYNRHSYITHMLSSSMRTL